MELLKDMDAWLAVNFTRKFCQIAPHDIGNIGTQQINVNFSLSSSCATYDTINIRWRSESRALEQCTLTDRNWNRQTNEYWRFLARNRCTIFKFVTPIRFIDIFARDLVDLLWLARTHLYRLARPYWSHQQLHYSLITSAGNVMCCIHQLLVCCAAQARKLHRYVVHVKN